MKKVAVIILALALVMGMVLPATAVSAVVADEGPIVIHKVILDGGPDEVFTFNVYRDFNNNQTVDAGDVWVADVVIDTAVTDTGETMVPWLGPYVIHEELSPGSVYQQPADQTVGVDFCGRVEVTFTNQPGEERGQLEILKVDEVGAALVGATFVITPDPKTGSGSMTLVDNGLNDEDSTDGVLLVTGCIIGLEVTVAETVAPPGYVPAPPQTVTISATVTLTFENTPEDGDATRTPGFWMTHCDFTQHVFNDHLGGSIDLGWRVLDSVEDVFGMFWANTAKDSNGEKRSKLCQAKVIGSFQLTAAILTSGLENGATIPIDPVTGLDLITAMRNALSGDDRDEILRLEGLLDTYNNSGVDVDIVDGCGYPVLEADPKCAKALADITIADCDLNG